MAVLDILTGVADYVIGKVRDLSKKGPFQLAHWYPKKWWEFGLPNDTTCYYCRRNYPNKGKYDKPSCMNDV